MYRIPEQLNAANSAAVQMMIGLIQMQLASLERIWALNCNASKGAFEQATRYAVALSNKRNVQDIIKPGNALAQPAWEHAMAYTSNLYGIALQAQKDVGKLVATQINAAGTKHAKSFRKDIKAKPMAGLPAVALIR